MRRSKALPRWAVIAPLTLATLVGGCSSLYYDRRETVSIHAGDAKNANAVAQMVDPWPRAAADRTIEGNGERMQGAAERYRTNKTTPLATTNTSSVPFQAAAPPAAAAVPPPATSQ